MAHPLEPSTPETRDISPITQPPSPVQTEAEDEDMITTSPEADQSPSVLKKLEDNESISGLETERSPPSPTGAAAEAADTTEDISGPDVQTRCVMSFLQPQPGKCNSRITNDDRHYISNFFGRNKSCSTSIPDEFYQVLCRKCMQGLKYRLKSGKEETEIQSQVAAIKHALQNMARSGKWVLVEVQFTKSEYDRRQNPEKYDADIKKFNDDVQKSREEAKQTGEKGRRRNTKKPLVPVPDWLAELVVRSDENENQNYTPVHERQPTRWTFEDLIALVDMIGENCDVLPSIECLPITQGELDRVEVADAREYRKIAKDECEKLIEDVSKAEMALKEDPDNTQLQEDLQAFQASLVAMEADLEDAEEELKKALETAAATEHTVPPKLYQLKRSGKKGESSKTAEEKGKQDQTTKTADREGEPRDIMVDQDVQDDRGAKSPSDHEMRDAASPSPPPGWKGKAKAHSVSDIKAPPFKAKSKASSRTSLINEPPTSPPPEIQEESLPVARAAATTPPPSFNPSTIPLPVTPNQPISSSPRTSTTRSTGRRMQRLAEREQAQIQTHGLKHEGDAGEQGQQGTVTAQGSPVAKRPKRSQGAVKDDDADADVKEPRSLDV